MTHPTTVPLVVNLLGTNLYITNTALIHSASAKGTGRGVYRLAWDGKLICALLAVFLRAVNAWYRRQARAQGYSGARCGS